MIGMRLVRLIAIGANGRANGHASKRTYVSSLCPEADNRKDCFQEGGRSRVRNCRGVRDREARGGARTGAIGNEETIKIIGIATHY